jgi:protein-disulfide isomerase
MPSGKRSKAQRRIAPPPVQSKGATRSRQANPRVLAAVGGVVLLVVIAVVLAVVFTGGSSAKVPSGIPTVGSPTSDVALTGATDVDAMFKGIPEQGLILGSTLAPVTLVEYIDLQCPFCQQFETTVMPDIIKSYVKTGKVQVDARVLDFIGPDSQRGREGMIAAGLQNRAFPFAALLYYNQGTENTGWLDNNMIATAGASIAGMNVTKLFKDMGSSQVKKTASTIDAQMAADGVNQTPTLYVGKTGTKGKIVPMSSATDKASLVDALDAALAKT